MVIKENLLINSNMLVSEEVIKKNSIFLLAFLSIMFTVFAKIPVFAHDLEYGVWHGEEDVLVLGTVEKVGENECYISVKEALPCKNILSEDNYSLRIPTNRKGIQ